jgi:hypothetical protein
MDKQDQAIIDNLYILQKELESISISVKGKYDTIEREKDFFDNLLRNTTDNYHNIVKNFTIN